VLGTALVLQAVIAAPGICQTRVLTLSLDMTAAGSPADACTMSSAPLAIYLGRGGVALDLAIIGRYGQSPTVGKIHHSSLEFMDVRR
jgi:hypothetical protein